MTQPTSPTVEFEYCNWEGRKSLRQARPISIRFGKSEWHPKPQWLMLAFDIDKGEEREFAMADMAFEDDALGALALSAPRVEPVELAEWKQAASVEASLRREFLARAEKAEAKLNVLSAPRVEAHCQTCGHTDKEYAHTGRICSDPWHSDDHLRKAPRSVEPVAKLGKNEKAVTVTIISRGDNENTPEEALHHGLTRAYKAGFIGEWTDAAASSQPDTGVREAAVRHCIEIAKSCSIRFYPFNSSGLLQHQIDHARDDMVKALCAALPPDAGVLPTEEILDAINDRSPRARTIVESVSMKFDIRSRALPPDAGSRKPALDPATVEACVKICEDIEKACELRADGLPSQSAGQDAAYDKASAANTCKRAIRALAGKEGA